MSLWTIKRSLFLSFLTTILLKGNLNKFPIQWHFALQIFSKKMESVSDGIITSRELVACFITDVIHQIQGWLACTVCQVHYSFIFHTLTFLGQRLYHLWIASDLEGRRELVFTTLGESNRNFLSMCNILLPDIVFHFLIIPSFFIFLCLSWGYRRQSRDLFLIKSVFALMLDPKEMTLLPLPDSAEFSPLTKLKTLLKSLFPPSSWPRWLVESQIMRLLGHWVPPSVSKAYMSWCIMHYR